MSKRKDKGINADLENAINSMLAEMKTNSEWTLTDKMKILDRALKLEAIKLKADSDDWGMGFANDDDEQYDMSTIYYQRGYSWMQFKLSDWHCLSLAKGC